MERIDELRTQLRFKRQEYKDLRNDYEIIKENLKANVDEKKRLRKEIEKLYDEYVLLRDNTDAFKQ